MGDILDRHRSLRILIVLLTVLVAFNVIGVVWSVLVVFGDVILMFLLAWIIAFILEPVSVFLRRRGMPRIVAVSLIYTALLVVVSGAIVLAIPSIEGQIKLLANELTTTFSPANLPTLNQNAIAFLRHLGFSQRDAQNLVSQISAKIPAWTSGLSNNAVNSATSLATSLFNIIFDASLIVILSFYMMLDGARLVESVVRRLPPVLIDDVRLFQGYVQEIFGGFFRAQLIIAGIYAAFTWVILAALGQANGLLVAVLSGIIMLLPFIGAFLAIVPPALLVLLQSPPDQIVLKLIILVIALGAAQHVVLNLIAPKVFGQHMGVPTLILFAALLLGAKEGGVWGAFFAGPVVAVGYAMFEVFYVRFAHKSVLFQTPEADVDDEPPPEPPERLRADGTPEDAELLEHSHETQQDTTPRAPATPSGSSR